MALNHEFWPGHVPEPAPEPPPPEEPKIVTAEEHERLKRELQEMRKTFEDHRTQTSQTYAEQQEQAKILREELELAKAQQNGIGSPDPQSWSSEDWLSGFFTPSQQQQQKQASKKEEKVADVPKPADLQKMVQDEMSKLLDKRTQQAQKAVETQQREQMELTERFQKEEPELYTHHQDLVNELWQDSIRLNPSVKAVDRYEGVVARTKWILGREAQRQQQIQEQQRQQQGQNPFSNTGTPVQQRQQAPPPQAGPASYYPNGGQSSYQAPPPQQKASPFTQNDRMQELGKDHSSRLNTQFKRVFGMGLPSAQEKQ